MKRNRRLWSAGILACTLLAYGLMWSRREAILDWVALYNYTPSSQMSLLASDATMTPLATHYLYVNHAALADRNEFNKHCTNQTEQSVVLGCFLGDRQGIYVYNVTAPELHGVQQVTAAHEMLHQAYQRLSSGERKRVDSLIEQYYKTSLQDDGIKAQIAEYQKTEPDALDDEMHSLFGTEVGTLPSELETYYRQYFTSRAHVVRYYSAYQLAFTSRKAQITAYDADLANRKAYIESLELRAKSELSTLDSMKTKLDAAKTSGDTGGYNLLVDSYNQAIATYNDDVQKLKTMINEYNDIVAKRNAIADQEQALQQNLSSKQLPESAGQ